MLGPLTRQQLMRVAVAALRPCSGQEFRMPGPKVVMLEEWRWSPEAHRCPSARWA